MFVWFFHKFSGWLRVWKTSPPLVTYVEIFGPFIFYHSSTRKHVHDTQDEGVAKSRRVMEYNKAEASVTRASEAPGPWRVNTLDTWSLKHEGRALWRIDVLSSCQTYHVSSFLGAAMPHSYVWYTSFLRQKFKSWKDRFVSLFQKKTKRFFSVK